MTETWSPELVARAPAEQQPEWPDAGALEAGARASSRAAAAGLRGRGAHPAGSPGRRPLRDEAFLLQAGDCAESFGDFSADAIRDKLKIILQMAVVLTYAAGLPVVKLGRIAGQFAEAPAPRQENGRRHRAAVVPGSRGQRHRIRRRGSRRADPLGLVRAYHQSAATLNLIRAFTKGGFADLTADPQLEPGVRRREPPGSRYEQIARQIDRALRFMAACGIDLGGRLGTSTRSTSTPRTRRCCWDTRKR